MKKLIVLVTCLLVVGFSVVGCGKKDDGDKVVVLKLAHGLDTTHPVHKGMEHMAGLVAEKSQGKLKIDIYPSEQLGSERECIEQLQIGALAMTKISTAALESFVPEVKVLGLPYLFRKILSFINNITAISFCVLKVSFYDKTLAANPLSNI